MREYNSSMNTEPGTDPSGPPLLALTLGDPAGIGPEIILKAWKTLSADPSFRVVVFGQAGYLQRAAHWLKADITAIRIETPAEARSADPGVIPCLFPGPEPRVLVPPGRIDPLGGQASFVCIEAAIQAALDRQVSGIVTAPISKMAIRMGGHVFPGHTEILARRCGVSDFAMMLYIPPGQGVGGELGLGVVHTTLHQSLRSALDDLSVTGICRKIRLAHDFATTALRHRRVRRPPRIAVAAVNPHAGELGLFGDEETTLVEPAISRARADGIECTGPLACDTLMGRAAGGEFDLVVAMYHDQGHIALKLLGMHKSVNVTLGLPLIRTSVAHGTAFEIAGTGQADCSSLLRATGVAVDLVSGRSNQISGSPLTA